MTIKKSLDLATGLAILAVSLFLFIVCYDLPEYGPDALGPRFFPLLLTAAMAVLSLIIIVQNIGFSGAKSGKAAQKTDDTDPVAVKMQWAFVCLLGLYILLLPVLGYSAATFGFCFLTMLLLGPKDKKSVCISALMAALTSAALTYIFGHILKLFLP